MVVLATNFYYMVIVMFFVCCIGCIYIKFSIVIHYFVYLVYNYTEKLYICIVFLI